MEKKRRDYIREGRKQRRRLNEEMITPEVLIRSERKNLISERRKKYTLAGKSSISKIEGGNVVYDEEPVSSMSDVQKSNRQYRVLKEKKGRKGRFYSDLEKAGYDVSELLKTMRSGKTY
jgi:hypothetical protein